MMEVQGMTLKEGKEKLVAHFPNNSSMLGNFRPRAKHYLISHCYHLISKFIKSMLAKGSRQLSDNQVSKIIFKQPKNLFNLTIKKSYLNSRSTKF